MTPLRPRCLLLAFFTTTAVAAQPLYLDPSAAIEARVDDLLSRMTLAEKVGQMVQAEQQTATPDDVRELGLGGMLSGGDSAPSPNAAPVWAAMIDGYQRAALSTRLHIPVLYGVDAVHGRQLVVGATIFPHLLGLAATRDAAVLERVGAVTAQEMAATGVYWTFSPMVAVAEDERWGRTYESFGEDPDLVATSSEHYVRGLMGALGPGQPRPLPTAKHFVGDGATAFGTSETRHFLLDEGDTRGETEAWLSRLLPPYVATLEAGTGCVMASYNRWNGVRMHANRALLTGVLKERLGFTGFVVSDWEGYQILPEPNAQAVVTTVNAGVDLTMAPLRYREVVRDLLAAVERGALPQARVDDAVRRILRVKFAMGLFEHPFSSPELLPAFGGPAHRAVAREAVAKSATLLENHRALPLRRGESLFVAGTHADALGLQAGGWTLHWQGDPDGTDLKGTSLLAGLREVGGSRTSVQYQAEGKFEHRADVGLLFVGERPYAEGLGDRSARELVLTAADLAALHSLRAHVDRLVLVLVAGRPLILGPELAQVDAVVMAWLPGSEGAGLADVLFGDRPFQGRLPLGWPRSVAGFKRADAPLGERCASLRWATGYGLALDGSTLGPTVCDQLAVAHSRTPAKRHPLKTGR